MRIISIMTDFGLKDGNVGVMKGVILGIAPDVQLVDISHLISAQNVLEGALILGRSVPFFPDGSIHIGVVDPGVGTPRRPLVVRFGAQYFVGPDNGLSTALLQYAEQNGWPVEVYHLDQPRYWLPEVSNVFHGRDVFSPVAAHLANGVPLGELGKRIDNPIRLELPLPEQTASGWRGQIIHIDHFGNIATNIMRQHLQDLNVRSVRLCGSEIHGLVATFGDRAPGDLIALFGSTGNLIVSVVNGDAARRLKAKQGDLVEVIA